MDICRKCKTKLTEVNWFPSLRKWHSHLCKKCSTEQARLQRRAHPKEYREWMNNLRHGLKLQSMIHYSGTNPPQCANPFGEHKEPYTNIYALSLDLIKGGHGRLEREGKIHKGDYIYQKLKNEGYPKGWQVLCMNCQFIKRHVNREDMKRAILPSSEGPV